jgi:hypothetical protein
MTNAAAGGTVAERKSALLERVRLREAAAQSGEVKQETDLRCRIQTCDNTIVAHKILQSLFARGEGSSSAASEAEIMVALCSASFAVQSTHKLDKPVAQAAVDLLAAMGRDWFDVKAGVHNPDAKYFRRLPKGSNALKVLLALKAERESLASQLRELCSAAERQQQEASELRIHEATMSPPLRSESQRQVTRENGKVKTTNVENLEAFRRTLSEVPTPCHTPRVRRLRRKTKEVEL